MPTRECKENNRGMKLLSHIFKLSERQIDGESAKERDNMWRERERFNKRFNKIAIQGTPQMAVD